MAVVSDGRTDWYTAIGGKPPPTFWSPYTPSNRRCCPRRWMPRICRPADI